MSSVITRLTALRNGGLRIEVNGAAFCVVDGVDWADFGLVKGDELPLEIREELLAAAERFKARQSAAASLAMQDASSKGLERKLRQKGISEEVARETVDRFVRLGFVQDEAYALRLANKLHEGKGYGRLRVAQELRAKGVERELAEQVLEQLPSDEDALFLRIEKKYAGVDWSNRKERAAAVRGLLRYGFSYEEVSDVVRRLKGEELE